jgi:hypothetical protein
VKVFDEGEVVGGRYFTGLNMKVLPIKGHAKDSTDYVQ